MAPKVLIVLTSQTTIPSIDKPTGWFLPEFAHPYYKLVGKCDLTIASPAGGEAPLDQGSVKMFESDEESQRFLKEQSSLWKNTEKLETFKGKASQFDAIFYVGGHGPMFDLANSAISHDIIREFYESSKVVSAVCHGPAALVNAKLSDGSYLIAGQQTTGFSNTEEDQAGMSKAMPFMLETDLKKNSGSDSLFQAAAEPWGPKVVISGKNGKLITGQNPASAGPVGEAILQAVGA